MTVSPTARRDSGPEGDHKDRGLRGGAGAGAVQAEQLRVQGRLQPGQPADRPLLGGRSCVVGCGGASSPEPQINMPHGWFCMSWKADFVLRVMEGGRGCGALAGELLQPARLHGRRLHGPSFEPGGGTAFGRVFNSNLLIHSARACRLLQ